MRSSALSLLLLAFAAGCDQAEPLAPADSGPTLGRHRIDRIDETSGTFEIRGFTGCFGELVVATGTVRYRSMDMTDVATGNVDHSSFAFILNGTAVGQTTGRVWKFKEMSRERFNTPNLPAPHFTDKLTLATHLVGPGGSVKLTTAFHVLLPAGSTTPKIVIDSAKEACDRIE